MKSKKLLSLLLTGSIALSAFPVCVYALNRIDMDYNSDEVVDVFDMISARKKNASQSELERLSSFLHGKKVEPATSESSGKDGYTLIWSDEFDGSSIDTSKWSYELGNWKLDDNGNYVTNGWGNNEQEFYTDRNASVSDGMLTIAARKENYTDEVQGSYEYTSSRLSTQHKFSTCGGRIEVRARCDSGKSLWPAIWMLPEDSVYGGWAASGEIDIMEGWGSTPDKICGTIHFGDVWPNNTYLTNDYLFKNGDSTEQWHTYSIEWDRNEMRWFVDDDLYSTQKDWYTVDRPYPAPFDQNFYMILNLAVGGHFDGIDGIYAEPATFANGEKHFDIDYVRVYSKDGDEFAPSEVTSAALGSYIEGADAYVANKDGCTLVHIDSVGTLEYGVMALLPAQKVHSGETWHLEFDAASTAEREMLVTVEDSDYNRYLNEIITVSPAKKHYSFDVVFPQDMSADIKFQLGNIGSAASAGSHEVTLYDIKWTTESAHSDNNSGTDKIRENIKGNENSAPSEMTSAALESYIEGADADVTNKDGCTLIHIDSVGTLEYGVMALLPAQKVQSSETWHLEFDAASTAEREMVVTAEDSAYTRYLNEKITLSPARKHFSFDVVFPQDMSADIKFQLGNIGNAASAGSHEVTLYNIKWTKENGS